MSNGTGWRDGTGKKDGVARGGWDRLDTPEGRGQAEGWDRLRNGTG